VSVRAGAEGDGTARARGGVGSCDTGFPKKGQHSAGVARQYCGVLGKQDNCRVAVSVSLANDAISVPTAYQHLPEAWAKDRKRRRAAGVPPAIEFRPKWQIALGQIRALQEGALRLAPVVADAGYGVITVCRSETSAGRYQPSWADRTVPHAGLGNG
jgi:SRSO17 transposase